MSVYDVATKADRRQISLEEICKNIQYTVYSGSTYCRYRNWGFEWNRGWFLKMASVKIWYDLKTNDFNPFWIFLESFNIPQMYRAKLMRKVGKLKKNQSGSFQNLSRIRTVSGSRFRPINSMLNHIFLFVTDVHFPRLTPLGKAGTVLFVLWPSAR